MKSAPYQFLPPLSPEERAALKADIAAHGILVPVERDEDGSILDGHERSTIGTELGIEVPSVVRADLSEGEKVEHAIKLNILRRHLGPVAWAEAFRQIAEARGIADRVGGKGGRPKGNADTVSALAAELGVDTRTARRRLRLADEVAEYAPELAAGVDRREVTAGQIHDRAHRERIRAIAADIEAEPTPLPTGPFRVIAADPPWFFHVRAEDANHRGRVPYPTMTVEEIMALGPEVQRLAHADAVLWLWTTNAHLEDAYGVARAWGFEPRTVLTWVKDRAGVGSYLRGQTEHCLMALRGQPVVTHHNQSTALFASVREHSRKPDEFFELVESLCPAPPGGRLEMFAREERDGWVPWGAEAPAQPALEASA
jgi:N6-adenosine-specific RNA methylase IME4